MRLFAYTVIAVLFAFVGSVLSGPPAALDDDAPAERPSAARAAGLIEAIAAAPRTLGGEAHERAGDAILRALEDAGFAGEVWSLYHGWGLTSGGRLYRTAYLRNILAHVPREGGTLGAPQDALLLMAHYDTANMTAGAGDNAMGVAAVIEAVRARMAAGGLERDLILFFTDGEEEGLLGARAFFDRHPWASDVAMAANFDSRGAAGAARLVQTHAENGALISAYARAARSARGDGILGAYGMAQTGITDLGPALDRGLPAMNFSALGGLFEYNGPTDIPGNLPLPTVQSMADQALAAIHTSERAGDRLSGPLTTYFELGPVIVRYPAWLGWGLMLVAVGLLGLATQRALREKKTGVVALLLAPLAQIGGFVLAAALATGAGVWLGLRNDFNDPFAMRELAAVMWPAALVYVALAVGALAIVAAIFSQRLWAFWLGGLWVTAVLAGLVQWAAPTAGFALTWPLVFAAALAVFAAGQDRLSSLQGGVMALAALAFIAPVAGRVYELIAVFAPPLFVLILAVGFVIIAPAIWAKRSDLWRAGGALIAVGVVAAIGLGVLSGPSERHPASVDISFVQDADAGQGYWATRYDRVDAWNAPLLGESLTPIDVALRVYGPAIALFGQPAAIALEGAPSIAASRVSQDRVRLALSPRAPGDRLVLGFDDLPAGARAVFEGELIEIQPQDGAVFVDFIATARHEPPVLELVFAEDAPDALSVRVASITQGIDPSVASALPPLPADRAPIANASASWTTTWRGTLSVDLSAAALEPATPLETQG